MTEPAPQVGPDYGFGLYAHWPYCAAICPYCDFNVYAARDPDNTALVDAICNDIKGHHMHIGEHPALTSVYLGGGTPSLLAGHDVAKFIETARETFGISEGAEITLEANPNDILKADLAGWQSAGVNRLSIGVQSLDDNALSFLGRDHTAEDARRAVDAALTIFPNTSIDLIYARPGQSLEEWEQELNSALILGAPHLSLYELTIAERTMFGKAVAQGRMTPMPDDDQANLYELTSAITKAAGLPAYEISNHAKSPAYQSTHNLTYWRSGDWIGVGPGAHGRLTMEGRRIATEAVRRPADYLKAVLENGCGWSDEAILTSLEMAQELLTMGLRPIEGIELSRIETLAGKPLDTVKLDDLEVDGFIQRKNDRVTLTAKGRILADHIAVKLAP